MTRFCGKRCHYKIIEFKVDYLIKSFIISKVCYLMRQKIKVIFDVPNILLEKIKIVLLCNT